MRVYHDLDAPVRDAPVAHELNGALQNARYIIVCASDGLGDSEYCRAEYLPALEHARSIGASRVIVAERENIETLPQALRALKRVRVDSTSEILELAHAVSRDNAEA